MQQPLLQLPPHIQQQHKKMQSNTPSFNPNHNPNNQNQQQQKQYNAESFNPRFNFNKQ
jgi:hypothetical protein